MKLIVSLSSIALISLASAAPSLAFPIRLGSSIQMINRLERQQRTEEQRAIRQQQQTEAAIRQQQQTEAYQAQLAQSKAAAEARREEARRQFESLTPEQQKEYIAQRQAERNAMWGTIFTLFSSGMGGSNSAGSAPQDQSQAQRDEWERNNRNHTQPVYQPAPAPVAPIGSIYGNGPGGSFYGH